jgi:hypothetical protein
MGGLNRAGLPTRRVDASFSVSNPLFSRMPLMAVVFGLVGGLLGVVAWAGIAAATQAGSGWMAPVIGGLVGFAASKAGNRASVWVPDLRGFAAVLITVLSVLGGKYVVGYVLLPSDDEIVGMFLADFDNEEFVLSYMADDVANEFAEDGRALDWPDGADPDNATTEGDFPADVWTEAEVRWAGLDSVARNIYRRERRAGVRLMVQAALPEIRSTDARRFARTYSGLEMIFSGLALSAAWGLSGSARGSRRPPEGSGPPA